MGLIMKTKTFVQKFRQAHFLEIIIMYAFQILFTAQTLSLILSASHYNVLNMEIMILEFIYSSNK